MDGEDFTCGCCLAWVLLAVLVAFVVLSIKVWG